MKIYLIVVLLCLSGTAQADEVLYCADTAATGFVWKGQEAQRANFKPERYTVKIVSETERIITLMSGDGAGEAEDYQCKRLAQKIVWAPRTLFEGTSSG